MNDRLRDFVVCTAIGPKVAVLPKAPAIAMGSKRWDYIRRRTLRAGGKNRQRQNSHQTRH